MRCIGEVDRRHGHPVVRNRKVELDAKCGPSSPVADPCFFDRWIRVEHGLAIDLVDAGVDMPADVRQHSTFQIFVFEKQSPQLVNNSLVSNFVAKRVGIVESPGCAELIK
jgi:hypothetical protein